jgi:DNA-binding winged helix-turn-helix (wHTH) protein
VSLTPREVLLVEVLAGSKGQIVTYETLYSEVLGRRFRGDTSNMRVLLGKLGSSIRPLGLTLQHHVDVIPKTGYRYHWSNGAPVRRTTVTDR